MAQLFSNNAASTLSAGIASGDLSVTLVDASAFPSPSGGDYFMLTIDNGTVREIVKCTARATNTLTIVRAQESTTAQTWSSGVKAELRVTAGFMNDVGYRNIPQNSQSTAYTCVLSDAGKHILHPSADTTARTFTIPANSSVAYPIGTAITFVNQASAGVLTISINTDTMRLAGTGVTSNKFLAANGVATAIKIAETEWIISGTGLTT